MQAMKIERGHVRDELSNMRWSNHFGRERHRRRHEQEIYQQWQRSFRTTPKR